MCLFTPGTSLLFKNRGIKINFFIKKNTQKTTRIRTYLTDVMRNPRIAALTPFSLATWKKHWNMRATRRARRGARRRVRGSYWDRNELAAALAWKKAADAIEGQARTCRALSKWREMLPSFGVRRVFQAGCFLFFFSWRYGKYRWLPHYLKLFASTRNHQIDKLEIVITLTTLQLLAIHEWD